MTASPIETMERRRMRRHRHVDEHGIVAARVRPGHRARVIDVSAGGALIETSHRLLPGTVVELHVERGSEHTRVRGRVLRCAVVKVRPTWVCYRGAIGFERHLPWLLDEAGCPMRPNDARSAVPERAVSTPEVM
jgi:hypothetical protein